MKAGTFSLAMIQPLTKPTTAGAGERRREPGRAPRAEQRRAGIERVRAAPAPTAPRRGSSPSRRDRSMPAAMMTKVWPEPEQQHRNDGDENVLRIADGEEIDRAAGRQRHRDDEEQHHQRRGTAHAHMRLRNSASALRAASARAGAAAPARRAHRIEPRSRHVVASLRERSRGAARAALVSRRPPQAVAVGRLLARPCR